MNQPPLFDQYLDPVRLKEGKDKCPCCGKLMRAYCKTLDKRFAGYLEDMFIFLRNRPSMIFRPEEIFGDDHRKLNDFQKLGYWGLINKEGGGRWKMSPKVVRFLFNKISLPKRLWVFNNKVILTEDETVTIDKLDPRWQECRADYAQDYVPQNYKLEL